MKRRKLFVPYQGNSFHLMGDSFNTLLSCFKRQLNIVLASTETCIPSTINYDAMVLDSEKLASICRSIYWNKSTAEVRRKTWKQIICVMARICHKAGIFYAWLNDYVDWLEQEYGARPSQVSWDWISVPYEGWMVGDCHHKKVQSRQQMEIAILFPKYMGRLTKTLNTFQGYIEAAKPFMEEKL